MPNQAFSLERMHTPTGEMLIVTDDEERLRALDWVDCEARMLRLLRAHYGPDAFSFSGVVRARSTPSPARLALSAYFEGEMESLGAFPVATQGSAFQRKVWSALRRIPLGRTASYGQLAAALGQPTAARAVGLANGANPIAIAVPCHRVIGANAALTGYAGGLDRKRFLLAHEGAHPSSSTATQLSLGISKSLQP